MGALCAVIACRLTTPPARTVLVRYSAHFHAVMRMLKAPANLHWLLHYDAMWVVVIHNENNVQKSCQKHGSGDVCAFSLIGVLWVEYSWGIRGVFVEYSWDIRMYRVCVGYVSGMYRESVEGDGALNRGCY